MGQYNRELSLEKIRGIDIVVKSISKKYPFIKGWKFNDEWENWETLISIDFLVDFNEFKKFIGEEKYKDSIYKKTFLSLSDSVGFKYYDEAVLLSEDIKKLSDYLYQTLPEEMAFYWITADDRRCKLSPSFFKEFQTQ
jgi:hypothetical protein